MRLIDADKLKKDVLDLQNCYNGFSDTYDKACIIGVIDEQPSAQPEIKCIAEVTLTEEQVKEAFEKVKCEILAAQPERKKGKWIYDGQYQYSCSNCGEHIEGDADATPDINKFCWNCGADMRKE